MDYQEWPAPEGAAHLIRCCWSLRDSGSTDHAGDAPDGEPALPDGCPELILNFGDPWCHVAADGTTRQQPRQFLVGQITGPFVVHPTGRVDLLAIRFEPSGAAALMADCSTMVNDWRSLDELRQDAPEAVSDVLDALQAVVAESGALNAAARMAQLAPVWRRYAELPGHADAIVQDVVQSLVHSRGVDPIDALAARHGVHLRTLQRRFLRTVGVSPKRLARIVRFHHVCQSWRRDPESLARVAADCGYCDESHLVRDFRDFVGEPPAAFLRALPAFSAQFL